jgi:hypothetical protein
MFESQALVAQLLAHLGAQVVDVLSLIFDLVGLLIQVIAKIVELLFGKSSCRSFLAIREVSCR